MKKFLLGTVGLVALGMAAPALAADMAVKAAPMPYVAPIYDWSGFYIGANGGWAEATTVGSLYGAGVDFAGLRRSIRRPLRWPARLSLASQPVGVRLGSTGRLGRSQRPAHQHLQSGVLDPHKINGIGLFTGQIGYAWNAALLLLQGRRGGDRQPPSSTPRRRR